MNPPTLGNFASTAALTSFTVTLSGCLPGKSTVMLGFPLMEMERDTMVAEAGVQDEEDEIDRGMDGYEDNCELWGHEGTHVGRFAPARRFIDKED